MKPEPCVLKKQNGKDAELKKGREQGFWGVYASRAIKGGHKGIY